MSQTPPVVVVGAGPVGLSLALALIVHSVPVVVLDQRPGIPNDMRATTVQPPTLELLSAWGVLDEALEAGRRVDRLQYWDWHRRELLADLDYALIGDDTPCPFRLHLPQARLCEILLGAIERLSPGTVRFGHKVTALREQGGQATATCRTPGGEEMFTTPRLCGADGAQSTVRQAVGLELQEVGGADTFLTCTAAPGVLQALGAALPAPLAPVAYLYERQDWAMVMEMADSVRFLFRAVADPQASLAREALATRMRGLLGPEAGDQLRGLGLYTVRQRIAERWLHGPVVLLGDAAHGSLPVGGTAMNEGIADAHQLARALLEGTPEALGAYESQRRAHVATLAAREGEAWKALNARGLWRRTSRNRYLRRLAERPIAARGHLLRVSMLEARIAGPGLPDLDAE